MRVWSVIDDKIIDRGIEVNRIGYDKSNNKSLFSNLDRNTEFIFPFTMTAHSLGDWGMISRLPECIKTLYPNSQIYIPSSNLIKHIFGFLFSQGWWSTVIKEPWSTNEIIIKNNPFIAGRLELNQLEGEIYTDHHRIFSNSNDLNEPLIEQILRAFGATEEEILSIDSRPKLYISGEENEWADEFLKKYVGSNYGCLLLASRIPQYDCKWEFDHHLFDHVEKFKHMPVFYYSSFDLEKTDWSGKFAEFINFQGMGLSFREQMIIKQKATFNAGYQAGITDSISGGGSEIITLTPYDEIKECIMRGVKYIFKDGSVKIY
jgi:hypothetical protein